MMTEIINVKKFEDINLGDPFFDSLKNQYKEFKDWFQRKSKENGGFEEPVFEVEPGGIPGFLGGLSGGTAGLLALHGRWRRQPLPGDAPYAGATFASHARRRML